MFSVPVFKGKSLSLWVSELMSCNDRRILKCSAHVIGGTGFTPSRFSNEHYFWLSNSSSPAHLFEKIVNIIIVWLQRSV